MLPLMLRLSLWHFTKASSRLPKFTSLRYFIPPIWGLCFGLVVGGLLWDSEQQGVSGAGHGADTWVMGVILGRWWAMVPNLSSTWLNGAKWGAVCLTEAVHFTSVLLILKMHIQNYSCCEKWQNLVPSSANCLNHLPPKKSYIVRLGS